MEKKRELDEGRNKETRICRRPFRQGDGIKRKRPSTCSFVLLVPSFENQEYGTKIQVISSEHIFFFFLDI